VFQRCPTRDEISFPVGQSNCKKGQTFQKCQNFKILQNFKKFKNHKIKKKNLKFKILQKFKNFILFLKNQNVHKISKRSKVS
jgi:hypothetical protein